MARENQPVVPASSNEAEEAVWWDKHQNEAAQWMEQAMDEGRTSTFAAVLKRARHATNELIAVSVLLDPRDMARSRALAAEQGVNHSIYLATLLRAALDAEEKRRA